MFLTFGAKTKGAVATGAATVALPGNSGRYLITSNTDCFLRFGGLVASSTNFDLFLPAGGMVLVHPPSSQDASVIRDTADGTLVIHEAL